MQTKLSRLWRIVRFCIAGAAGVTTYYTALYCLTEYLGVWYVYSSIVGFILNQAVNFTLQKFWTFKNTDKKAPKQAVQYFVMGVSLLGANTMLLYILVDRFHVWYVGAQLGLTIGLTVVSYLVSGKIFKRKELV